MDSIVEHLVGEHIIALHGKNSVVVLNGLKQQDKPRPGKPALYEALCWLRAAFGTLSFGTFFGTLVWNTVLEHQGFMALRP